MAVAFIIETSDMTHEHYNWLVEKFQRGGKTAQGRIFHAVGPIEGGWRVIDVWESQEAFDTFVQETLSPALREVGVGTPKLLQAWPVHNLLSGPEHHL